LLARAGNEPQLRSLLGRLLDTRQQLANLTLTVPKAGQEKQRVARLDALTRQEQQLTKELGQKSGHLLEKQS
jgi:hypothetical protein